MKREKEKKKEKNQRSDLSFSFWALVSFFFLSCFIDSCSPVPAVSQAFTIAEPMHWKSMQLYGKERNFAAFNKDLLTAVAKEQSLTLHFVSSQNPVEEVKNKQVDAALAVMTPLQAEDERLIISDPYFLTGPVLILPREERVKKERGLGIYLFAIPDNSPLFLGLEADPDTEGIFYNDIIQGLMAVKEKKVDGAIYPILPAYYYTDTFYRDELKIASSPLTDEGVRLIARDTPAGRFLIEKFNQGLKKEQESGAYHARVTSWALPDTGQRFFLDSIEELKKSNEEG